ncbi:hypothetical protein BJ165DRAFT_1532207 [Panaeolus papilionaceus]|nr:hypothetical protein BJ165DRAFT_1532207 [Panaeolus papilionaceus]
MNFIFDTPKLDIRHIPPDEDTMIQDTILYGGFRVTEILLSGRDYAQQASNASEVAERERWFQNGLQKELLWFLYHVGQAFALQADVYIPSPLRFAASKMGLNGPPDLPVIIEYSAKEMNMLRPWRPPIQYFDAWWLHNRDSLKIDESLQSSMTIGYHNRSRCLLHFHERLPAVLQHLESCRRAAVAEPQELDRDTGLNKPDLEESKKALQAFNFIKCIEENLPDCRTSTGQTEAYSLDTKGKKRKLSEDTQPLDDKGAQRELSLLVTPSQPHAGPSTHAGTSVIASSTIQRPPVHLPAFSNIQDSSITSITGETQTYNFLHVPPLDQRQRPNLGDTSKGTSTTAHNSVVRRGGMSNLLKRIADIPLATRDDQNSSS